MTMPSNSGTRNFSAHDRVKINASAARTPSARPRASTEIRVAGRVASDASTADSRRSAATAASGVLAEAGMAESYMAHRRTVASAGISARSWRAPSLRFRGSPLSLRFFGESHEQARQLVGMLLFHPRNSPQ